MNESIGFDLLLLSIAALFFLSKIIGAAVSCF